MHKLDFISPTLISVLILLLLIILKNLLYSKFQNKNSIIHHKQASLFSKTVLAQGHVVKPCRVQLFKVPKVIFNLWASFLSSSCCISSTFSCSLRFKRAMEWRKVAICISSSTNSVSCCWKIILSEDLFSKHEDKKTLIAASCVW